jgi:hypothetical protein
MWPPRPAAALPRGPIHADLFRDNVMFDGEELTGFFDFYFRRRGHLAVRPGRVPERLVHRPRNGAHDASAPKPCWTPTRPCAR